MTTLPGTEEAAASGYPGYPGMPGGMAARGMGMGAPPRYGVKPTVMPRPPADTSPARRPFAAVRGTHQLGKSGTMDFALLPPEVNSGRMHSGPGSGSPMAAVGRWDSLSAELDNTAATCAPVFSSRTGLH